MRKAQGKRHKAKDGGILHVIPHLWSGAGVVVTRLCESQRARRRVAIVTAGACGPEGDWRTYRQRLHRAGVAHHRIDFFKRDPSIFWSSVDALADLIDELKPTVIHAHAGVPSCGAVLARERSRHQPRVIAQMYSWGANRPEWMNHQDLWGYGQSDRVVCSALAYRDLMRESGIPARKIVYLPWGLPLDELPARAGSSRAPLHPCTSAPVLGFVGRIERRKNQLQIVKAFAQVRRKLPAATLELVGPIADETYAAELRAYIERARLDDGVTLTGEVSSPASRMRRWNLFVSLSSDEGQGLAVLEAMALGVPVLARPVAGIADFLRDGVNGFAIESESPRPVSRAIVRALGDPEAMVPLARRARRMVEEQYAWCETVAALDRLYRAA